jgi:hypothetical protein
VIVGDGAIEVLGVLSPVGALVAVPGGELVAVGRIDRIVLVLLIADLLIISLWEI